MLVRILGVCPRGDQVRLSGQTNDCPFSSINTRVAPRSRHFFYPGPRVPFPVCDRCVIMLEGEPLWLLTTPVYAPQEIPYRAKAIPNTKQIPDQMSNAIQRPIVLGIAVSIGTLQQGCVIRGMPITDSGACRSPIPAHADHRFRR